MDAHESYMRRCFELAQTGNGLTAPNPLVGAVIVHQNQIIGEGWHRQYGGPHAEVNAIRSVADPALLPQSTLYCSLEPCFHYGKTPPCVDLILHHHIGRVVIANTDPNPLVAGKSVEKMSAHGIEVISGVLEEEGRWLNRIFFHWITHKKPYIVLKWAQSADGFIGKSGERTAISGPLSRRLVHRWRTELSAILVGAHTALTDNPQLDNRLFPGKTPLRIALDNKSALPENAFLLDDSQPTWIIGPARTFKTWERTDFKLLPGADLPEKLCDELFQAGYSSLLVEGGSALLHTFIQQGYWDEIRVITAPKALEEGIKAPALPSAKRRETYRAGNDQISIWTKH